MNDSRSRYQDDSDTHAYPGVSSYNPRCSGSAINSRLESSSRRPLGVEQNYESNARSQEDGGGSLAIVGLVVAIVGLGNLGIAGVGLSISIAALRLATATAYYGAAGAGGYAAFQGSRYAVQQARPGVSATIRAANSAARQVQARAIAINAAALQAAIATQSSVAVGADVIVDRSNVVRSQVVDGAAAMFRTVSNSVHDSPTRHPEVRQEPVPVEILSPEEARTWTVKHSNDGIDRLEEQQLDDGTLVWSRIVHHEDPAVHTAVEGIFDSNTLSTRPEVPQGEVAAFEIITAEEARTRITENPDDDQMYYFEEQPSYDGRLIWRRMGHDADREDGVIMLQLPAGNATNGSTAAEVMTRVNDLTSSMKRGSSANLMEMIIPS
jgi:hypothetical protein